MACAGELQQLIAAVEAGRGGCLVVEGVPVPSIEVPPTSARVLRHRASPEEQLLTHAALVGLCRPLAGWLDHLPEHQAEALGSLIDGGSAPADGLGVASAFRALLQVAASFEPLVVVVEQAHLLDRGSAAAVGFAARDALDVPLAVLVTQDASALGRLELPFAPRCRAAPTVMCDDDEPGASLDLVALAEPGSATDDDGDPDRLLAVGAALLRAGDLQRAQVAARAARRGAADPATSARAELLLGRVRLLAGDGATAVAHLRAAVEAAEADRAIAAEAALLLALPSIVRGRADRVEAALDDAAARMDEAGFDRTHHLRALHAAAQAALDIVLGRAVDEAALTSLAQRLVERGEPADVSLVVNVVALPLVWLEHHEPAASLLRALVASLRARGAMGELAMVLCALSVTERRAGRPTRALVLASEARELAERRGLEAGRRFALSELANVHGIMGDLERCRAVARTLLEAEPSGRGVHRTSTLSGLATAELWVGDPSTAVELLEPLAERVDGVPQVATLSHPVLITAYVAVGRHGDAERLLRQLEPAARPGRTAATVARCRALLAPADQRDDAFAAAIDAATGNPLSQGFTRLLHARRLLADREAQRGAALLRELADLTDEDLLGIARAARLTLARLGMVLASGDPAWATVEQAPLDAALAAVDGAQHLGMAGRVGLGADALHRLRDEVAAVVGYPIAADGADLAASPAPHREIRVLGGLAVVTDGHAIELPAGAASTAVAVLALRRAVHVEELAEVLWPGASVAVARRRLRNVLSRIRHAAGPILVRRGDRIVLAEGVTVDHHELEVRARRALAEPPGPERARLLSEVLCAHQGALLPEAAYEEWSHAARRRAEVRYEELLQALTRERDLR